MWSSVISSGATPPAPRGLDEDGRDRGRDDAHEADPGDHHERGHGTTLGAGRASVAVADGRDRLDREPHAGAERREVLAVDGPHHDAAADADAETSSRRSAAPRAVRTGSRADHPRTRDDGSSPGTGDAGSPGAAGPSAHEATPVRPRASEIGRATVAVWALPVRLLGRLVARPAAGRAGAARAERGSCPASRSTARGRRSGSRAVARRRERGRVAVPDPLRAAVHGADARARRARAQRRDPAGRRGAARRRAARRAVRGRGRGRSG